MKQPREPIKPVKMFAMSFDVDIHDEVFRSEIDNINTFPVNDFTTYIDLQKIAKYCANENILAVLHQNNNSYCDTYSFEIEFFKQKPNPKYEEEIIKYNEKLEKYKIAKIKYDERIKKEKDIDKNKRIQKLESELKKLKSE